MFLAFLDSDDWRFMCNNVGRHVAHKHWPVCNSLNFYIYVHQTISEKEINLFFVQNVVARQRWLVIAKLLTEFQNWAIERIFFIDDKLNNPWQQHGNWKHLSINHLLNQWNCKKNKFKLVLFSLMFFSGSVKTKSRIYYLHL